MSLYVSMGVIIAVLLLGLAAVRWPNVFRVFRRAEPVTASRRQAVLQCLLEGPELAQPSPGLVTLGEFIDEHFRPDVVERKRSKYYNLLLDGHILPALGGEPILAVNREKVQQLITAKAEQLAPRTVKNIHSTLRRIFVHATSVGYRIDELPTDAVVLPSPGSQDRQTLSAAQILDVAGQLENPHRVLFLTLAMTGLRVPEALGLQWRWLNLTDEPMGVDDLRLDPQSLLVRQTWRRSKAGAGYQDVNTKASKTPKSIPPRLRDELAQWKLESRWNAPADPVFTVKGGRPMDHKNALVKVIKPVMRDLGLPEGFSWRWLRHTAAGLGEQVGVRGPEHHTPLPHSAPPATEHSPRTDRELLEVAVAENGLHQSAPADSTVGWLNGSETAVIDAPAVYKQ